MKRPRVKHPDHDIILEAATALDNCESELKTHGDIARVLIPFFDEYAEACAIDRAVKNFSKIYKLTDKLSAEIEKVSKGWIGG